MKFLHYINKVLRLAGLRLERTPQDSKSGLASSDPKPVPNTITTTKEDNMNTSHAPVAPSAESCKDVSNENTVKPPVSEPAKAENQVVAPVAVTSSASCVGKSNAEEVKAAVQESAKMEVPSSRPAHEELARIQKEMPAIFERAAKKVATGELELIGWGLSLPRVQKMAAEHEGKPWFFIGDVHGDFLALHRLLEQVRQEKDFRICFLGDLVDRGPLHIECFAALLGAVERNPNQIMWIMGNHDIGVGWNRSDGKFFSRVQNSASEEAEFPKYLNTPEEGVNKRPWGQLFVDIVSRLPRAVLFADGLLATHGGVPLNDRWPYLKTTEAFHHIRCLEDFTFSRIVNYPRRVGYTKQERAYSSDMGLGYKDLEDFCTTVQSIFPVKRVICGHEHVENGHEMPSCCQKIQVLKINGFGFDYLKGSVYKYRTSLALAVAQPDQLPKVEDVFYSAEEHAGCYPLPAPKVVPAPDEAKETVGTGDKKTDVPPEPLAGTSWK